MQLNLYILSTIQQAANVRYRQIKITDKDRTHDEYNIIWWNNNEKIFLYYYWYRI